MPTPRFAKAVSQVQPTRPTAVPGSGDRVTTEVVEVASGGGYVVQNVPTPTRTPLTLSAGDSVSVMWRGGKPFMILNAARRHGPGTDELGGGAVVEELFIAPDPQNGDLADVWFRNHRVVAPLKIRGQLIGITGAPLEVKWGRRPNGFVVKTSGPAGPFLHIFKFKDRDPDQVVTAVPKVELFRILDPAGADGAVSIALPFTAFVGTPTAPGTQFFGIGGTLATLQNGGYASPPGIVTVQGGLGNGVGDADYILDDDLNLIASVLITYTSFTNLQIGHGVIFNLSTGAILRHTMLEPYPGQPNFLGTVLFFWYRTSSGCVPLDVDPPGVLRVTRLGFDQLTRDDSFCTGGMDSCTFVPGTRIDGFRGRAIVKGGAQIDLIPLAVTQALIKTGCGAFPSCTVISTTPTGPAFDREMSLVEQNAHRMLWLEFHPFAEGSEPTTINRIFSITAWDKIVARKIDQEAIPSQPTAEIGRQKTFSESIVLMELRVTNPDFMYASRAADRFFVDAWSPQDGIVTIKVNALPTVLGELVLPPSVSLLKPAAGQPQEFTEDRALARVKKLKNVDGVAGYNQAATSFITINDRSLLKSRVVSVK